MCLPAAAAASTCARCLLCGVASMTALIVAVGQHLVERGAEREFMLGGEVAHRVGLERDAARETDRRAELARRLHQFLPHQPRPTIAVLSMRQYATAAGAPGCLSGCARANASISLQVVDDALDGRERRDVDLEEFRARRLAGKADVGDA